MKKKILGTAFAAVLVAVAWGCSSDDDHDHSSSSSGGAEHTSPYPSCQAILDACHPLDVGEGPIHDCHELAHETGTEQTCAAKKAECLTTCSKPDAGDAG
jgi:hypothetical protein